MYVERQPMLESQFVEQRYVAFKTNRVVASTVALGEPYYKLRFWRKFVQV
jgi:hypothetical protein